MSTAQEIIAEKICSELVSDPWVCERTAERIINALHLGGYVIAKIPQTTDLNEDGSRKYQSVGNFDPLDGR